MSDGSMTFWWWSRRTLAVTRSVTSCPSTASRARAGRCWSCRSVEPYPSVGRHVLVAWNGSRETTLAVQHALPFIRRAERVTLLEGTGKERFPSVTRWPLVSMEGYLMTQAERIRKIILPGSEGDAGAAILRAAAQSGADLVVMGAYGRSWLAEWVLGGATRHVLRHACVPLLMAS
ncbi:universal stress protein [Rubellimicrobium roseum]|uniref:Universal stress protein n=1 Tax=Rubellimicrobium roseum TaxID=687525 RepID=A0A5C4N784_9RHOB|nr:universal stress protein [Rubellimicrobium roseum]